jgi:hypothetical protein
VPAYRSSAEGEVRAAVVERLRQIRPTARIMHEVNASSFGNRIDVLAVDRAEIIAVEIKSAKDKLDRLPAQMKAMKGCATHAIAVVHRKFVTSPKPKELPWDAWVFPEGETFFDKWREPRAAPTTPLPAGALDMLWAEELREMCRHYGLPTSSRATMGHSLASLRWSLTGRDLTLGVCAALRSRVCIEADDPIEWVQAA